MSLIIDRLAPNGDLMIARDNERLLSRGSSLSPVSGSANFSRSYWVGGQWYIVMGATLVAVDTTGL